MKFRSSAAIVPPYRLVRCRAPRSRLPNTTTTIVIVIATVTGARAIPGAPRTLGPPQMSQNAANATWMKLPMRLTRFDHRDRCVHVGVNATHYCCGHGVPVRVRYQATVSATAVDIGVPDVPNVDSNLNVSRTNGASNSYDISARPRIIGLNRPIAFINTFGTERTPTG